MEALEKGIVNLGKHIENLKKYNVPVVVTLNKFISDTDDELDFVKKYCEGYGCSMTVSEVWEKGGEGGIALAEEVLKTLETKKADFKPLYDDDMPIKDKIRYIAENIYGAKNIVLSKSAENSIKKIEEMGFGKFPICMAKTQYSLSDDPTLLGRPQDFVLNIREVYVSAGAGFVVALTGSIMTMPGLPKHPAAESITVDDNGIISGLF